MTIDQLRRNELLRAELRGAWLGVPQAYNLFDFTGAALGAYFIYSAVGKDKRFAPPWFTASLGVLMIFIHTQRFFYAPQTKEGLRRLLTALDIKPEDIYT